jgi:hypothetical protein
MMPQNSDNVSCGTGPSISVSTPAFTVSLTPNLPCFGISISISLPSFSFSFSLPSLSFFLSLFLEFSICDLSLAFNINAGVAVAANGGCIANCVPDPSLAEETYAVAA